MKRVLLVGSIVVATTALAVAMAWRNFIREEVHETIISPDGSRTIAFLKRHVPPYVEGVDVTAEYRRIDGEKLRLLVHSEDLWTDFDTYSDHEWLDSRTLRLGSPDSFSQPKTGSLRVENLTEQEVEIVSMDAGGQIFLLLDVSPGEVRTMRFPMNTWLEWISVHFAIDGSSVYRGTNFTTKCSPTKESDFAVRLLPADVQIENHDFEVWKTWPNKAVDPTPGNAPQNSGGSSEG